MTDPPQDPHDEHSPTDFEALVEQAMARTLSRRALLGGVAGYGACAFVLGAGGFMGAAAHAEDNSDPSAKPHWLDFEPVAANTLDTITVPKGFSWHTVISWGDPMWSKGQPFDPRTRGDAASQALAFGARESRFPKRISRFTYSQGQVRPRHQHCGNPARKRTLETCAGFPV